MTIAEAFSAHETIHKARILKSMFGHLAPEPRKVYTGHIIFSFGCFGDHHIVDTQFDGVCSSPWFFEDVKNFVDEFIQKRGMQGRIYHTRL